MPRRIHPLTFYVKRKLVYNPAKIYCVDHALAADREGEEIHKDVRIRYEPVWRWLIH